MQKAGTIIHRHDLLFIQILARLSELAEPIRELSMGKIPFNWGPEHQEVFNQMKREIVRTPILAYYNPRKETVLQTATSTKGLDACLLQEERLVYFFK